MKWTFATKQSFYYKTRATESVCCHFWYLLGSKKAWTTPVLVLLRGQNKNSRRASPTFSYGISPHPSGMWDALIRDPVVSGIAKDRTPGDPENRAFLFGKITQKLWPKARIGFLASLERRWIRDNSFAQINPKADQTLQNCCLAHKTREARTSSWATWRQIATWYGSVDQGQLRRGFRSKWYSQENSVTDLWELRRRGLKRHLWRSNLVPRVGTKLVTKEIVPRPHQSASRHVALHFL